MSKIFEYNLGDRVMVPALDNTQGIVYSRTERTSNVPEYRLLHLDKEGMVIGDNYSEAVIVAAQPEVLTFNLATIDTRTASDVKANRKPTRKPRKRTRK